MESVQQITSKFIKYFEEKCGLNDWMSYVNEIFEQMNFWSGSLDQFIYLAWWLLACACSWLDLMIETSHMILVCLMTTRFVCTTFKPLSLILWLQDIKEAIFHVLTYFYIIFIYNRIWYKNMTSSLDRRKTIWWSIQHQLYSY